MAITVKHAHWHFITIFRHTLLMPIRYLSHQLHTTNLVSFSHNFHLYFSKMSDHFLPQLHICTQSPSIGFYAHIRYTVHSKQGLSRQNQRLVINASTKCDGQMGRIRGLFHVRFNKQPLMTVAASIPINADEVNCPHHLRLPQSLKDSGNSSIRFTF
jgi:hypothetical protein